MPAPLLICCTTERRARKRPALPNNWLSARHLPARVVLRADQVSREGLPLALAVSRVARTGGHLPRVIALELRSDRPLHFLVAALLLCHAHPTPRTRNVLRRLRLGENRTPPVGSAPALPVRVPTSRLWQSDLRGAFLARLDSVLRRRPTPGTALRALVRMLTSPPKSPEHMRRARTVVERASRILEHRKWASAPLWNPLLSAVLDREPPPLDVYRALRLPKGSREGELARAAVACAYALGSSLLIRTDSQCLHAATRAETRARRAGLQGLAAVARAYRRKVAWRTTQESIATALHRSLRSTVLARVSSSLWITASDVVDVLFRTGILARRNAALALSLLQSGGQGFRLSPNRATRIFGPPAPSATRWVPPETRRHLRAVDLLARNRFRSVAARAGGLPSRSRMNLHVLSLGVLPRGAAPTSSVEPSIGERSFLVSAWGRFRAGRDLPGLDGRDTVSSHAQIASLCMTTWRGSVLASRKRDYLLRELKEESAWALRMIIAITCAMIHLRENDARKAARACAEGVEAYRGFLRLCREEKVGKRPDLINDYEKWCRRILAAFEPSIDGGIDPVRTLVRTMRRLPRRRRRPRPDRVLDALDALITAGHAGPGVDIERRVVRDLARMLRSRVLLHYAEGRYLTQRPQTEHTLSTWTLRRLITQARLRAYRVRRRPEFWQPEQRRPRGLLVFPIGTGIACIARQRPFDKRETRAVRTVLRFLDAHRGDQAGRPRSRREHPQKEPLPSLAGEGLIGTSRPWRRVLGQVVRVARAKCPVILVGETGTGKEYLARALHSASQRSQASFVAVNCGAFAPDLLASELFGHIRGAFTGADRNREGLLRHAHRGTLFLDEVAEMPSGMQVALLRVIEERKAHPVGSTRSREIDVRIVCATHSELRDDVDAGRFREDLFHRLNVVCIRLPPLRERTGDLPLLIEHLLAKTEPLRRLHPDSLGVLAEYAWPGNIRELHNVLRAAALLTDDVEITPEVLAGLLERRRIRTPDLRPSTNLGPRAEALLGALGSRWLSAPELAGYLGVSPRTVNRLLTRLMAQGLVHAHGEARARTYRRSPSP